MITVNKNKQISAVFQSRRGPKSEEPIEEPNQRKNSQ